MARITGEKLIKSDATLRAWLGRRAKGTEENGNPCKASRRLNDGGGLVLLDQAGKKPGWRFEYEAFSEKLGHVAPNMVSLGTYPATSLEAARTQAQALRDEVAAGGNPAKRRQAEREAIKAATTQRAADAKRAADGKAPLNSLEDVARRLMAKRLDEKACKPAHAKKVVDVVCRNLKPIAHTHVAQVTEDALKACLDVYIERGQRNTAKNMLDYARQVLSYARLEKLCKHNPAADLDADKYIRRPQCKSNPKLKDQNRLGELVNAARNDSERVTGAAVLVQVLLFQRSSNTCGMRWDEIDWSARVWKIPAHKVKLKGEQQERFDFHVVPLPKQVVRLLLELRAITGHLQHVFVARTDGRDVPMSRATLLNAIRRYGFTGAELTAHGLRGTAFTAIKNHLDGGAEYTEAVEANLAHVYGGAQGATYNESDMVEKRRPMLQAWADHVDACADGTWARAEQEKAEAAHAALKAEFGELAQLIPAPVALAA